MTGEPKSGPKHRWLRLLIVCGGLLLPQVVLYGPSLTGSRLLLPLDVLRLPRFYLPTADAKAAPYSEDTLLCDAVDQFEPMRRFAISELRARRFPQWWPGIYGGVPFIALNHTAALSPLRLLDYAWESPRVLAWRELLKAILAGAGAYLFFRMALGAGFWAAAVGSWCFPLCGFLVLWANHPQSSVALALPWLLLATERTLRFPGGFAPIGLAAVTGLTLVSGHSGIAVHLLIGSALYASGRLLASPATRRPRSIAMLAVGWLLGMMLSGPQTLPSLDYLLTSARIADRLSGLVETPQAGPAGLVQLVLPYAFGSDGEGLMYLGADGNRMESAATGYVGLVLALGFFPMGIASQRGRPFRWFIALFAVVGLAQILGLPGISHWLSLGPLATLRNHRLVLLTGFALLSGAVLGADALLAGERPPRWLALGLTAACGGLAAWALYRGLVPPPGLRQMLDRAARLPHLVPGQPATYGTLGYLPTVGEHLARLSLWGAVLALGGGLLWQFMRRRGVVEVAMALAVVEAVAMARGVNPQRDPALYYPRVPALAELAGRPWGRALCIDCMPPNFLTMTGLDDVRGYDGADPIRWLQLMFLFRADGGAELPHARLFNFVPRLPSPIADLLGVRYLIYRGTPPPELPVVSSSPGLYVVENQRALPRAFVPERVERSLDPSSNLARLARTDFDPRRLALVETQRELPEGLARGKVSVVADQGARLSIDVRLQTPGAVVIIDRWDEGWRATYEGVDVEVLRADHALRAVLLPAGNGRLELRYAPESMSLGLRLAAGGLFACIMLGVLARIRRRDRPGTAGIVGP